MSIDENLILTLVRRKVVTDTFRRLGSEKKERIYRSALKLFGEYGYDGLSVDRFCREAGLSKGSFFQYFPAKHDLLELTILQFDSFLTQWLAALRETEKAGSTKDRLRFALHALSGLSQSQITEWRFLQFTLTALRHSAIAIEGVSLDVHILAYLGSILRDGQMRREVRTDCNIHLTASAALLLILGILDQEADTSDTPSRVTVEQVVALLLDGVGQK